MKKIISWLFAKVPAGYLKDSIRKFYYNSFEKNEFDIDLNGNTWIMRYPDFTIHLSRRFFPYHVLRTNFLFLHHFPIGKVDLLVDAGAYIGTFICYVKKRFPHVEAVLAFEPDPSNRSCLEENLQLNGFGDAAVKEMGLWSKEETLSFYIDQKLASSVVPGKGEQKKISINVGALDSILNGVSGKRIFIKMNIEGAELKALEGSRELIRNNKVHLAIAADHTVDGKLTVTAVEELCRSMGLSVSTFRIGRLITVYASNEYAYDSPVTV